MAPLRRENTRRLTPLKADACAQPARGCRRSCCSDGPPRCSRDAARWRSGCRRSSELRRRCWAACSTHGTSTRLLRRRTRRLLLVRGWPCSSPEASGCRCRWRSRSACSRCALPRPLPPHPRASPPLPHSPSALLPHLLSNSARLCPPSLACLCSCAPLCAPLSLGVAAVAAQSNPHMGSKRLKRMVRKQRSHPDPSPNP